MLNLTREQGGHRARARTDEGGGNFLVTPGVGLMIWTLIAFGVTFWVLGKFVFPRVQEPLDKRQRAIEEAIEGVRARAARESRKLLEEYRGATARGARRSRRRSSCARARPPRSTSARHSRRARHQREELLEQTRRDIEGEYRRAIQEIRNEVADLTGAGDREGHAQGARRRRTSGAWSRKPCTANSTSRRSRASGTGRGGGRRALEEIAQVYSRSLFEVAKEHGKIESVIKRASSTSSPMRSSRTASSLIFFFSPYFSSEEKKRGLGAGAGGRGSRSS